MNHQASFGEMLGWTLFVIVLLISTMLFADMRKNIETDVIDESCAGGILVQSKLQNKGSSFDSLPCETKEIKISSGTNLEIAKDISGFMASCWGQFGEGKLELFSVSGSYCAICSNMTFTKGVGLKSLAIEQANLVKGNVDYFSYLQGSQKPVAAEVLSKVDKVVPGIRSNLQAQALDTSKDYSVVYLYSKDSEDLLKKMKESPAFLMHGLAGNIVNNKVEISYRILGLGSYFIGSIYQEMAKEDFQSPVGHIAGVALIEKGHEEVYGCVLL